MPIRNKIFSCKFGVVDQQFGLTKILSHVACRPLCSLAVSRSYLSPHCGSRTRGFTLIELLTIIVIIGVLAVMVFAGGSKVYQSAQTAQCANNLRQMGAAILLSAQDHNGMLPGPFLIGQGFPDATDPKTTTYTAYDPATCNPTQGQILAVRLGPYMGLEPTGQSRRTSLFVCPAFGTSERVGSPSYVVPPRIDFQRGSALGDGDGYKPDLVAPFGTLDYPTHRLLAIQSLPIQSSLIWAITDCFLSMPGGPSTAGWASNLPKGPIHGRYGNALFFDGHVGKIDSSGPVN